VRPQNSKQMLNRYSFVLCPAKSP